MLYGLLLIHKSSIQTLISFCCNDENFDANIVNQEHKDRIINTNSTQGFKMVQPTMPTSTDERKLFHYTVDNIIEERTRTL